MALSKSMQIAIVAVIVVAIAGAAAFIALGNNDDNEHKIGVTYYGNGGVTADGKTSEVYANKNIPPCVFSYAGHEFQSWNTKADGSGKEYKEGDPVDFGLKLYAKWKEVYSVEDWNFNGEITPFGKLTMTMYDGSTWGVFNSFSKFDSWVMVTLRGGSGWTLDSELNVFVGKIDGKTYSIHIGITGDGVKAVDYSVENDVPTIMFKTLSDIRVSIDCHDDSIYYLGNGGVTSGGKKYYLAENDTVESNMFTNGDKTFKSWNTKKDGTGTTYNAGDKIAHGSFLFAIWE